MKKTVCIMVIALAVALVFTACPVDDPDPKPQTATYSGTADGTTYTLTIDGDSYVLTVGTKTSSGTVTKNGSKLTLTPSSSGASAFTVTVSSSGITAMNGTITFDDGTTQQAPTTVTPVPPPNTGNPLEGTWLEADGTIMTIAGNTITITSTYEGGTLFGSGTVTVNNNTITVSFTAGEQAGQTFNGTFSLSNNGNTLTMAIGGENTTWTKQGSPGGNIAPFVLTGVQATDGDDNSTLTKDFHYIYSLGDRISDLIENPSVKLINGKVSISFDKPKNWNPQSGNLFLSSLTFTEEDNDEVILGYGRNGINAVPGGGVLLAYTETARTLTENDMLASPIISFVYENWETVNLNVSVQRGWNYMVLSFDDFDTATITSGAPNSEFEWFVYVNDEDD